MKKLALVLLVLFFACSVDPVEETPLKAKPGIEACDFVPLPDWADTEMIMNRFNWTPPSGNFWGVSVSYQTVNTATIKRNSIVFGYLASHTDQDGNNYRDISYRFNVYDGNTLVESGCVNPEPYSVGYEWRAKKNKVYTVVFPDYPGITTVFTFSK